MLIRHPARRALVVVVPHTHFITSVLFFILVDQEIDVVDIKPNVVLCRLMRFEIKVFLIKFLLVVLANQADRINLFLCKVRNDTIEVYLRLSTNSILNSPKVSMMTPNTIFRMMTLIMMKNPRS